MKTGEIPSISAADIVTAITANNKKIKRIDPNAYLNESIEYLSYNIFPLAKDQAGCRFLQEKLEIDPNNPTFQTDGTNIYRKDNGEKVSNIFGN